MTQDISTSEVLNRAADLIEERGWGKGGGWNYDDDGSLCLEGGVMAAMGHTFAEVDLVEFIQCPAYQAVQRHLNLSTSTKPGFLGTLKSEEPLWGWNDADNRTATEVIEVLRATAVIEAARETDDRSLAAIKHAAGMFGVTA